MLKPSSESIEQLRAVFRIVYTLYSVDSEGPDLPHEMDEQRFEILKLR
jgi:hypothetical protein